MSQDEWTKYVQAFNNLTTTQSGNGNGLSIYEQFTADHDRFAQHSSPLFLAWHRLMLWEWDKALNAAEPGVVQPYFEWAVSADDLFSDSTFSTSRYGGSAGTDAGGAAPIPNGPWQGLQSDWRSPHSVDRNFLSSPLKDEQYISDLISEVSDFGAFTTNLEHEVHDEFHVAIGGNTDGALGDMSLLFESPNDPLFYAHHAYTDQIYRRWQAVSSSGNAAEDLDAVLEPWGKTVREVLEGISNCVVYDGVDMQAASASFGPGTATAAEASSDELLFDSASQKRSAQATVAEKKSSNPNGYKEEVARWAMEQEMATAASQLLGADPQRVANAKVTTSTILLKRGVDIVDAGTIAELSTEQVVAEGQAELAALESGAAPPAKASLDDVVNKEA
jgi:Common central domain of tyrosinase